MKLRNSRQQKATKIELQKATQRRTNKEKLIDGKSKKQHGSKLNRQTIADGENSVGAAKIVHRLQKLWRNVSNKHAKSSYTVARSWMETERKQRSCTKEYFDEVQQSLAETEEMLSIRKS
ncbi:glycosidase [Anopheles sinensis]|uniref:Glycosidase n=1 Tax=Anopheles sinensis TaxID=74873 RepID=A0A084VYW8_ANOSI|nr:glycosidase [Anopheles sinensis]